MPQQHPDVIDALAAADWLDRQDTGHEAAEAIRRLVAMLPATTPRAYEPGDPVSFSGMLWRVVAVLRDGAFVVIDGLGPERSDEPPLLLPSSVVKPW